MTTILIVEDEADLVASLEYGLRREGYETRWAATGESALDLVGRHPAPDLVLLDLMLPDMSGKEVCRRIRADERTREIPVVMVTARATEVDRIVGFELGADDYVTKPYSIRELTLRIGAILRRGRRESPSGSVAFGALRIDPDAHTVTVAGEPVVVTALEFRLLSTLASRRGRVQTRDTLLEQVWGLHGDSNTRTVDTHIKRLRQKLGAAGDYIETVRGVGYRFLAAPPDNDRPTNGRGRWNESRASEASSCGCGTARRRRRGTATSSGST